MLGLKPKEFWSLTPREFTLMLQGAELRHLREARYVQYLLSPHMKRIPKAEDIAGVKKKSGYKVISKKEHENTIRDLENVFGGEIGERIS